MEVEMINLREAEHTDIDAMLALREQWLATLRNIANSTDDERAWFSRCPGNSMAPTLVAEDGRQLVGYIMCALMKHPAMPGTSALIDEVCVAESHRRRGIGRLLVEDLRRRLIANVADLSAFSAKAGHEDETARAFLHALGFEQLLLEFTDYLE